MSRFDDVEDDEERPARGRNRGSSRSIDVPPLVACQSVTITWAGQTPFHVSILDTTEDGDTLKDFGEMSGTSTTWSVDRDVQEVVFALIDASGETTFSDPQPIQPGDCLPKAPESETDSDPMAQVFSSATTKYQMFSSASPVSVSSTPESSSSILSTSTSETPSSSSSSTIPSSLTSSTSSSTSTSMSTSMSSVTPTTKIVQIVTLTQTKSTSRSMGGDPPSTISSSEELIRSTALSSDLHQKEGSKTGVAVGVTLGLGIPILLIFLAYYLHRRRAERTEEPYAKFADLHSRPHSSFTSRSASSIYSLRTEDMLARPIPPVPPIPAVYGDKRKSLASASITSFGLPYEWQDRRGVEELSPFGDQPVTGYGQSGYGQGGHKREGSEMGDSVYGGIDGRR